MNKKSLMISVTSIIGVFCILVGSVAYYRTTINGNIKGSTGNAVFNVTGFTNESTKEIVLKEGELIPGDKGSFTLSFDATNSVVDMYVTLSIDKGTLPTNLKFYTTSDYKSELHKYYEFMDTSNQSKNITIYWYWNPFISNQEDNKFVNKTNLTATVNVNAVQISEYATMLNDNSSGYGSFFWNNTYRPYIRTIKFGNDLSNLPSSCTGDTDLCWDVSKNRNGTILAYLIDSGLDYIDSNSVSHDLYNLYIVSEMPIFAPVNGSNMFNGFTNLVSIDFNGNFNTSKVTDMQYMFSNCTSLTDLDLSGFNTSNVTDMKYMFNSCSLLTSLDISSFNTSNVTSMAYMFSGCSSLTSLDISSFNTSNVTSMLGMFASCRLLTSLDLSSFNTSNVKSMSSMFNSCSSLTSFDLSNFNTSKVVNMSSMFRYCSSLTSLDLSGFNTLNVGTMNFMFDSCSSLINLDLSSFNTSKVTGMYQMFGTCSSLTNLDLSSFNTANVSDMYGMFFNCSSLTSLDLSSFTLNAKIAMSYMFSGCSSLTTTINITSTGVTSYNYMFSDAATNSGAKITVNYIADASTLVDNMIATKSSNSNVVKGVQL